MNNNNDNNVNFVRLNQERQNVINATIDANKNIDQNKATNINNQIKYKKTNPIISLIFLFIVCIFILLLIYFACIPLKKYLYNATSTTIKTTTTGLNPTIIYIKNLSKVRKFQKDNFILILSKEDVDMKDNSLYYVLFDTDKDTYTSGKYTQIDDIVTINNIKYNITENGLVNGDDIYKVNDSEFKYYTFKDNSKILTLIINGTLRHERAIYIKSVNNNTTLIVDKYIETNDKIEVGKIIFNKTDDGLNANGYRLSLN